MHRIRMFTSEGPKISKKDMDLIEHYSNSSLVCDFWNTITVRQVVQRLVEYIRYLEGE